LDARLLTGLRDETANARLGESICMPEREKRIVLGIVRQLGEGS
jgi:hypothetical protein